MIFSAAVRRFAMHIHMHCVYASWRSMPDIDTINGLIRGNGSCKTPLMNIDGHPASDSRPFKVSIKIVHHNPLRAYIPTGNRHIISHRMASVVSVRARVLRSVRVHLIYCGYSRLDRTKCMHTHIHITVPGMLFIPMLIYTPAATDARHYDRHTERVEQSKNIFCYRMYSTAVVSLT